MTGSLGGDTPAVARERVRSGLRRARRNTELTQSDVARRLRWSLSKVQRIETGEVAVSETDIRALLQLYGITAASTVAAYAADANLARRERWTTPPEYRKYLTPGLRRLLQFEVVATRVRSYQSLLLPGVLQTPALAEYIIEQAGAQLTAEERRVRLDVRLRRRRDIIERPDGPRYYLVIDESVLLRTVGDDLLMAEQLEDLAKVAAHPHIFLRIVPLDESEGAIIGTFGNFQLMSLSDEDADDTVLYRERHTSDRIDHDVDEIRSYRDAFESLWMLSLPEDASLRLISYAALGRRVRLDRRPVKGQ
ncbi:helix-turn-helix domain-containing protein [Actinoplanes solisilvae]|uniref:helix-turn-helix domain-containing protein n=1 Tax=Actinoplanes solisilvae TaxID=2486853 RepID=UPI000FD7F1F2|nr:helix-turn-helix transcriptional regulator [Actinoplanes solisilvae]